MAYFVTVDPANNITGLYTDDPGYATPPVGAIAISDADGETLRMVGFGDCKIVSGAVQPSLPDFVSLKTAALAAIDAAAGSARAKYITVAPGQDATYLCKARQAADFKAAAYTGTTPTYIQAEIDATGATAQGATDAILAQEAEWDAIGGRIESARRCGKVAVGLCANDQAAINAARDAAIASLGLL